jgi:hypothetical protein
MRCSGLLSQASGPRRLVPDVRAQLVVPGDGGGRVRERKRSEEGVDDLGDQIVGGGRRPQ